MPPTKQGRTRAFLCGMRSAAAQRRATRWSRRLIFALVILLNLWLLWRFYQAYQQARHPAPQPWGQFV